MEEYFKLREIIENRIQDIEVFYEIHFDEPFVLNFEKGRLKLKKLLMNEPYYITDINKTYENELNTKKNNNIMTPSLKDISNNNKLNSKNNNIYMNANANNSNSYNNFNNLKTIYSNNPINTLRKNPSEQTFFNYNINESNRDLLNNNIFNNKLISSYILKEKDFKKNEENKKNDKNNKNNENKNDNDYNNNLFKQFIDKIDEKPKKFDDYYELKLKKEDNNNNNIDSNLFNVKQKNIDNKTFNNEMNNNFISNNQKSYSYESIEEDNSLSEKVGNKLEKNQKKEASLKFVLNEDEYGLLMREKAFNINPLKESI